VETRIKLSQGIYTQVKDLADKGGLDCKLVADELIREGFKHLSSAGALAEAIKADPNIRAVVEDGVVYYCEECNQVLDVENEPEKCPGCGVRIDWTRKPGTGGGMGFLGWGLVGLAALLVMGTQRRT